MPIKFIAKPGAQIPRTFVSGPRTVVVDPGDPDPKKNQPPVTRQVFGYSREFPVADHGEPYECTEQEWLDHLKPSDLFEVVGAKNLSPVLTEKGEKKQ